MDLDVFLADIAAGDPDAFGRWVAGGELRLRESLRSFAALVDTEAVLQETLLRTWQIAPRVEPDGRENVLLRVAIRIGRNHAIDEVRRTRSRPTDPADLERAIELAEARDGSTSPAEPDPLLRETIQRCREELPPKPALALHARLEHGGGQSDAAIAADLGMKLNTFLQNFTRARKLLADCLARRGVSLEGAR